MIRKVKLGALAAMASMALLTYFSSGAIAAEFHAASAPVTIKGNQSLSHNLTFDPGTVNCTSAKLAGEMSTKTTSTLTLTPTYSSCVLKSIFGNIAVTVSFNECDYVFSAWGGEVHINCPLGKSVVISGPGCTVTVPAQTLFAGTSYVNREDLGGNISYIEAQMNASGIKYSYTGFTCGSGSNTTNGTHKGTFEVLAYSSGYVDLWYE